MTRERETLREAIRKSLWEIGIDEAGYCADAVLVALEGWTITQDAQSDRRVPTVGGEPDAVCSRCNGLGSPGGCTKCGQVYRRVPTVGGEPEVLKSKKACKQFGGLLVDGCSFWLRCACPFVPADS